MEETNADSQRESCFNFHKTPRLYKQNELQGGLRDRRISSASMRSRTGRVLLVFNTALDAKKSSFEEKGVRSRVSKYRRIVS